MNIYGIVFILLIVFLYVIAPLWFCIKTEESVLDGIKTYSITMTFVTVVVLVSFAINYTLKMSGFLK